MTKVYTEADLAAAWESGYWHGTSHTGPRNDAAVAAENPHTAKGITPAKACKVRLKAEEDRDAVAKHDITASNETPS
jgi:phage gp29-like protein